MKNVLRIITFLIVIIGCGQSNKATVETEQNEIYVQEVIELEQKIEELELKSTEVLNEVDSLLNSI